MIRTPDVLIALALAAGIGIAMSTQTAINTQLRYYLSSPIQAAFISFLIGTLCLALMVIFSPQQKPTLQQLMNIPWWLWLGGFLGVYCITISIYSAPKLGFLTFTGLVLFGQVCMSMLLDHFGLLGVEKAPLNWQRILGSLFIAFGILLTLQR